MDSVKNQFVKKRICRKDASVGGQEERELSVKNQPVKREAGCGGGAVKRALSMREGKKKKTTTKKKNFFCTIACKGLVY